MNYHWNWRIFWEPAPDGTGTYLDMLLSGLVVTIEVSLCAWLIALALGSVVGVLRTLPSEDGLADRLRLRRILPQHAALGAVVPVVLRAAGIGAVGMGAVAEADCVVRRSIPRLFGIGLFMSARVAEQIAGGIGSLPRGQKFAATALGLTTLQTYRYVLLPIAFRIIMPPLTSEFLNTIKNTSVAITIGLVELTGDARSMQEFSSGVRGLHRCDRAVSRDQCGCRDRHARCLSAPGDPGLHQREVSRRACSPISISTSSGRSLAYLFFDGMTFTLMLTGLATIGGLVFGT